MPTFPTDPALEAAVVADAGDDTPRLVYADWLDEHDAPIQAEFVRTQCRLAARSAADPDWVDLIEQQDKLVARLKPPDGVRKDIERRARRPENPAATPVAGMSNAGCRMSR